MDFNEHGSFSIITEGKMLVVRALGAFNQEGTQRYCNAVRQHAETLKGTPFVLLVDLTELEGATPDSWSILEEHNRWLNSTSMVAKAIVATSSMVKVYAGTANMAILADKLSLFEDCEAAKVWLDQRLEG